jgi:hypothetical protein
VGFMNLFVSFSLLAGDGVTRTLDDDAAAVGVQL